MSTDQKTEAFRNGNDAPVMSIDLKDTLNLPTTSFPMRGDLVRREPERIKKWAAEDLYQQIQQRNSNGPCFVLHDGPPFTNGDVHIGTALNKILKDTILRYKSMRGFRTPYVPGWDCHGLPIEHKVARELRSRKQQLDPLALRQACAEFSSRYIEKQRAQFIRLGILADWEQEYRTMQPGYEADILRTFAAFVEQDLVYRSKKPVYWSIPCETALAEAEIEYKDHTSPSIWVRFNFNDPTAVGLPPESHNAGIVIWTTTPWTLPANMAVALHPELEYVLVHHDKGVDLVAADLAATFIQQCELNATSLGKRFRGKELEGLQTNHPFIERPSPVVLADYVTTESGTGCVHTAPGHGPEDYVTGSRYGLDVYCPLDDQGCYLDDGEMPASLVGISVLEQNGKCPANDTVIELLQHSGNLLQQTTLLHQYPHCWRSKTPVIYRAMDQWFVSLDKNNTREQCLQAIESVQWIPAWGQNRIRSAVETRPDWCISRQRSWGVPIPVFYDSEQNAYLDAAVIRAIADKIAERGTDFWFAADSDQILADIPLPANWPSDLVKGTDTLDVWIDSGCSHRAVLQQNPDLHWPADLYLEGSDQHRGWFQSSLWTGVIADQAAPYKAIITHGFIVDENRRKISKSDGKPQTADGYVQQYGADILRLWLSSEDYRNDIPISDSLLKQISNHYRTIRNTLRFLLGNLNDFSPQTESVAIDQLLPVDHWALAQTQDFLTAATTAYEAYEFHKVYQLIVNFCNVTLSAGYHDLLKDRLYTYAPQWSERKSAQTVLKVIFETLVKVIAPILTFTADEAWAFYQNDAEPDGESIHLQAWPDAQSIQFDSATVADIKRILEFRSSVHEHLEYARQQKTIGQSLDAEVVIEGGRNHPLFALLQKYNPYLNELFIVSSTVLIEADNSELEPTVKVTHAPGVRCPRSWRWVPELVSAGQYGSVSPRCKEALTSLSKS